MDTPSGTIAHTSMPWRRVVAFALVAVAAFSATLAVLLHSYVLGRFARVSLSPGLTFELRGKATYFDPLTSTVATAELVQTTQVSAVQDRLPAATTVWDVTTQLTAGGDLVAGSSDRVAVNRISAESVSCCGATPGRTGLTYAFPPGAARHGYRWFDPLVEETFPASFEGRDTVRGLVVYRYVSRVQNASVSSAALPAAQSIPPGGGLRYDAVRTAWVEPRSGEIVKQANRQRLVVRSAHAPERLLLDMSVASTPRAVSAAVSSARSQADRLRLVGTEAPVALLVVTLLGGAAVAVVGRNAHSRSGRSA